MVSSTICTSDDDGSNCGSGQWSVENEIMKGVAEEAALEGSNCGGDGGCCGGTTGIWWLCWHVFIRDSVVRYNVYLLYYTYNTLTSLKTKRRKEQKCQKNWQFIDKTCGHFSRCINGLSVKKYYAA